MSVELTTLDEYIKVQGGYAYKSKDFSDTGIFPVLKIKNVRFGTVDYSEASFISEEIARETTDWKTKEGDILISMTGSGPNAPQSLVGRVARVWEGEPEAWINQRVGRIVLKDKDRIHPDFIFYLLSSPRSQDYLVSNSSGSANQANISGKTIESLPCPKIGYDQSAKIAKILREIDQKILINNKANKSIEEIAKTIFKSWFVNFDPTRAKIAARENGQDPELAAMASISGKTIDELNALSGETLEKLKTTAALFPDHLVDSELGEIPDGWSWSEIGDEVSVVGGGTPSTKNEEFWDGGHIPWTSPKDMSNLTDKILLDTGRKITKAGLAKISSGLLPKDTVLMSSRAPVGYLAISKIDVAINQGYIAMKCEKRLTPEYVVQWAESVMDDIKQRASGTTFAEISKKNFKIIPVVVPNDDVLREYSEIVAGFYNKISENLRETKTLTEIRDTLLPKLLAGEISLSEAV